MFMLFFFTLICHCINNGFVVFSSPSKSWLCDSESAGYQDTETETAKWDSAIFKFIFNQLWL